MAVRAGHGTLRDRRRAAGRHADADAAPPRGLRRRPCRLWWEFVDERHGPWTIGELAHAARLLGRLAARRRVGAAVNDRLPDTCRIPPGAALRYLVEGRVLHGAGADLADDKLWSNPVLADAIRAAGDTGLRDDLRAHLPLVMDVLAEFDALPQTYAHGDASIQNILICNGEDDLVVIDWGFGSPLASTSVSPSSGRCTPASPGFGGRPDRPGHLRGLRAGPRRRGVCRPMVHSATSARSSPGRSSRRCRRSTPCVAPPRSPCAGRSGSGWH